MKLNKIGVILMGCLLLAGGSIQAQSVEDRALQELRADSSARTRFVTRATMYGVGYTNVYDTYLSPQEYKGIDFRISRESMRMTKWMNGNISLQSFFQADLGYTHNRVDNNNTFSGLANWNFRKVSSSREKQVGKNAQNLIIINTVIPFLYAYGLHKADELLCERATGFLESLKAEDNHVIRHWSGAGLPVSTAADSQALLQLQKEYCDKKDCLRCRFGFEYLRRK